MSIVFLSTSKYSRV